MIDFRFLRNVLLKALVLFAALNLLFTAWTLPLGRISAYNRVFPGRERFPFGENPQKAYNLSLYDLDAMFASHELDGAAQAADEYRVLLVGDSSTWGTLLTNAQTLAGQLNAQNLKACDGRRVRFFNLGYPTISLTKDLMVLDEAARYHADHVIWLTTLEAFPRDKQLDTPLVANNPARVGGLIGRYGLKLNPNDPAFVQPSYGQRTLVGQRRALADLFRLQMYGVLWAATGIDQEYPEKYLPAQRDLDAATAYHGWQAGSIPPDGLALDVLDAGMQAAGSTRVLLVNEPMLVSSGKNSDVRYNFFYPRWVYDQYRQLLGQHAAGKGWPYLDMWNTAGEQDFTNSAIHLTPAAEAKLAVKVAETLLPLTCR
jgi:hypothetical protein